MLFKLTIIVWIIAVVAFFSEEFTNLYKKIHSVPGLRYLVPVAFFSWLTQQYQVWGLWTITGCREIYHDLESFLLALMPADYLGVMITRIIILWTFSIVPLLAAHSLKKYQYTEDVWSIIAFRVAVLLWVTAALLIAMQ